MQPVLSRRQNQYDSQSYSEWRQLPPNLPCPTTPNVQAFYLKFDKILYLQQISQQTPYELRIQWWGVQHPHQVVLKSQGATAWAKYIVCCPLDGLLSYLSDMKVVAIEICTRNRPIGKTYLNFLVLKGWKGELYEGHLDIKQGKRKIGEINYSIEISSIANPYLPTDAHPTVKTVPTTIDPAPRCSVQTNTTPKNREKSTKKAIFHQNQGPEKRKDQQYIGKITSGYFQKEATEYNQSQLQESLGNHEPEIHEFRKRKPFRQNQFPTLQLPCARNYPNYEAELVRLAEDFNLLFSQRQHKIFESNSENIIEIQLVSLQLPNKETNNKVLITLPMPQAGNYQYRVGIGGFIKVCISSHLSRQHVISYLKTAQLYFQAEMGLTGTVKLSKILATSGEVVEVPLVGKDKRQKLKGTCLIKAIPPPSSQSPPAKQIKETVEVPAKQDEKPKVQFILFSLKSYNPVEPFNRKVNLYVKIYQSIQQVLLGQSKTVWNTSEFISFDDNVTCQTTSDHFRLQLLDRQRSDIILGEGELLTPTPIGITVEIPIYASQRGKKRSIGYLCLDFVRNGLNSVTKMISILGRTNSYIPLTNQQQQITSKQQNKEQQHNLPQKDISQSQSKQEQSQSQHFIDNSNEKEHDVQVQLTSIHKRQAYHMQFDRSLSELQIYNKLFTFLYQSTPILAQLAQQSSIKITLFLELLQPLLQKRILSLKELNLIITKHLFSSPESGKMNEIDLNLLRDSYDAFSTYYEELVEQRDQLLKQLLAIMEAKGISINDLEYLLKNNKNIWQSISDITRNNETSHLKFVEAIRNHYEQSSEDIANKRPITAVQFCDALRRFQVYQTTLGQQIQQKKLQAFIYEHLCQFLVENQPEIFRYSFRQLIEYLQEEQVEVSQWEMLNIQQHLKAKNPRDYSRPAKYQLPLRQYKLTEPIKKENISQLLNKPTISKSPTFGYLHAPQVFKHNNQVIQSNMTESLDVRMNNLPISPINYQSSQPPTQGLRAFFSNLAYSISQLCIDGKLIDIDKVHNYTSNNKEGTYSKIQDSYQSIPSKKHSFKKQQESQLQSYFSVDKTIRSNKLVSKEQIKSCNGIPNKNIEVSLSEVMKKFSYQVEVYFEEQASPIVLQCVHEQWCSLVSDEGEYLGGILIV